MRTMAAPTSQKATQSEAPTTAEPWQRTGGRSAKSDGEATQSEAPPTTATRATKARATRATMAVDGVLGGVE